MLTEGEVAEKEGGVAAVAEGGTAAEGSVSAEEQGVVVAVGCDCIDQ